MIRWTVFMLIGSLAPAALAGPAPPLSEPGSLALLGVGAVAAVVVAIRNRRK